MRLKLTIKQTFIAAIALALLVFFSILAIYLRQSQYEKNSVLLISSTHDLLFNTERMLLVATEIETNSRALLLTGQPQFNEAYQRAKREIPVQSGRLAGFISDKPHHKLLLDSLLFFVNQRIAFSDSIIRQKNKMSMQDAVQLVSTAGATAYLDNIKRIVTRMQLEESKLLEERKKDNRKETALEQAIFLVISLIMLCLLIILFGKEKKRVLQKEQKKVGELFHLLANSIKDYAIFMLDKYGTVKSWSNGAEYIKGYQKDEIIGKSSEIFYTQEDIKKGEPGYNLKMAKQYGRYETEGWRLKKGGIPFWANIVFTALKDDAGNLYGYSKITRDISEKRKIEEDREFLLRQINQANDAIYTVDAKRKIKSWNRGAEILYGFTKEEVLDKDSNEILRTDLTQDEIDKVLKQIEEKDYWMGELQRTTKNGTLVYVRSSTTTIRNSNGDITGYVAVSYDITGQKRLQEEINHLASMVEQSSEAIISVGLDKQIISWNCGAEKLHGYSKEEAIGKTAAALKLIKLSEAEIAADIQELFDKGFWKKEMYFFHKDGSSFFGSISANLIKNEQGEVTAFFFIVKDISIRKQLEEQLKKYNEELEEKVRQRTNAIKMSEKRYRYLFENNPMPMWVIDLTTFKFLDVNEMAIVQYGYSRDEFLSMTALDIRPPEDKESFINADHSFEINPADYNRGIWKHRKKDGTVILVEIIAHEIIFEGIPARFILANNVTEKKKAEEKLVASENRFRALIENNYDIITLMDASFKVIYRSPSTYRITGWSNEEMINSVGTKNIHPDDIEYFRGIISEIMAHPDKVIHTSFRSRHKNGNYLWLEGTLTNLLHQEHVKAIVFNSRDVTGRIKADEELAFSEIRFRSLIENSAEGISLLDAQLNVIYRSPSGDKLFSAGSNENSISFAHPDELERFKNKFADALSMPGIPVPYQVKYLHPKGYYFWAEGTFTNLLHLQGVNAVVANYHDITERIEAEEKLASSENRFRALVEKNKDVIMLLDENFKITYRSPSATEVNGWTDEDVKTMSGIENIHPDDVPYTSGIINEMMAKPGQPFNITFRSRHKKGHFTWLEGVVTNFLHDKNVNAVLFNFRDVTERIEAEEKLKASEEQFRYSMDNMLEGVQIIGFDWRYIYVNDSMAKHGRCRKEELIGYTVMEKYPGIEHTDLYKVYLRCFNERVAIHLEHEFIFPDKTSAWFELSFLPVPEGIFILSIDITERKLAEAAIKKLNTELEERVNKRTEELKKSNEELEAFSYSVSHDLRAPLRAVIGFSAILEEDYSNKLDDEAKRITTVIKNNTKKMGNLIDDLLTFSRMGRNEIVKTTVNSMQVVDEIIKGLDSKVAANIEWAVHPLPVVNADTSMIRQVWINLISNAVKYSVKNVTPKIEIGSFIHNRQTVFFVEDNGVGFDDKYKNKLFKVFQRLHSAEEFEGTGIGLAIVDKIVSKHGGHVWAEAELNNGASFYFSLP